MSDRDIAVVGMACVFPAAADMPAYWRNIVNGVNAIREIPAERWPGARNIQLPREHDAHIACTHGGFIPTPFRFDPLRFKVMPNVVKSGDIDQFVILQMIDDALRDAGIGPDDPCRADTDVIVGRGGYTSNKALEIFMRAELCDRLDAFLERRLPQVRASEREALVEEIKASLPDFDVDSLATSIPNLVASRAANRLNLRGAAYNVDAACASSLLSVEQAMRRLREGLCEVGVACGVNFTHTPPFWYLFTKLLAVSLSGRIAPFDRNADGLLLGEGAGAVVLKRAADARRDGDRVYAVVKGAGSSSDGREVGVLAPSSGGQVRALQRAYADAGVDPDSIGYLEGHGTATVIGDATELQSIKAFFGSSDGRPATRTLGSVKSMIGHTMPAAGIASLIKSALALSNKILPPSLHCDAPHPELEDAPFFVNTVARPWLHSPHHGPRRAGINAFGFGGINAHVVLEEVIPASVRSMASAVTVRAADTPPPAEAASEAPPLSAREIYPGLDRPSELLLFSGDTVQALVDRVRRVRRFAAADRGGFTLEDLAYTLVLEVNHDAPVKLGTIVDNLAALDARLEAVETQLLADAPAFRGHEGDFFSVDAARPAGRVAALFPGLAFPGLVGHYPDHLMKYCMHFPRMREAFDLVEARDEHPDDRTPTSYLLNPPAHLPETERTRLRQRFSLQPLDALDPEGPLDPELRQLSGMGMLISNWASWRLLEPFCIPVEMLCGQSLGDISAVCASGMTDFEGVIPRLWKFMSLDPRMNDLGCLAFIGASEERLMPLLEKYDDLHVALHQSENTIVVGGSDESIEAIVKQLRSESIIAQKLPFSPLHTPHVREKQSELMELEAEDAPELREPRITVYSAITKEPMPSDRRSLREVVASNLTRPVRFWQTLRRMHDDGARIFIQVGSGTLAGNIRTVLPEGVVTTALDVDYRDPVTQLQHVCGQLFTAGVRLALHQLFQARRPRELPLDEPVAQAEEQGLPLMTYLSPLPPGDAAQPAGPEMDGPRVTGAGDDAAGQSSMPFVGQVLEFEPGRSLVQIRRFDLSQDLYLGDHAFINCLDVKPLNECFPVVPLTMTLEMLAQTGACLAPGLGPVRIENIRAKRWIALDEVDTVDVRVEAEVLGESDGEVRVRVEAFCDDVSAASAEVHYASRYRLTCEPQFSELTGAHPLPIEPERLYSDNYFFHGPRFQCIASVAERGDQGVVGELEVLPFDTFFASDRTPQLLLDPVVLDGAGQMLGTIFFDKSVHILPVSVDKIEFYRPAPPTGTRVPIRLELVEVDFDERRVRCNMEIQDGEGQVWMRIEGWRDIMYRYSERLLHVQRDPRANTIGVEQELPGLPRDGVAVLVPRSQMKDADPERVAQSYLASSEMPAFRAVGASYRRQREWLLGRIAVKDAARIWLARHTGRPMPHPVQVAVETDEAGRPYIKNPEGFDVVPQVSIAHTGQAAAAVAAEQPVGIDMEPADAAGRLVLEDFATREEIRQVEQILGTRADAAWATRLWCGKEAAAKALGTGLQGRPKSFEAVRVELDGGLVVEHGRPPRRVDVRTCQQDGTLYAVACLPEPGAAGAARQPA